MTPRAPGRASFRTWQWRTLFTMMASYLFYYLGRQNISIAIPLMKEDLNLSNTQVGAISSGLLIAYGIGQVINGNLGDRFGARVIVAVGGLSSMVMNWITSFGNSFLALIVPWTANGYVQSMGWAPGSRMISNWWPRRERGKAFGLYMLAAGCSSILAFVLATLVGSRFGWRGIFRIPVVLLGGISVIFFLIARNKPEDAGFLALNEEEDMKQCGIKEHAGSRYLHAICNWRFLLACLVIGFQSFSRYGLLTWVPDYYVSTFGFDIKKAGLLSAFLPVGMACGAVSSGFISDKVFKCRRCTTVSIFLGLAAVVVLLARVVPLSNRITAVLVLFAAGFFVYGAQSPLWAMCPDLLGRGAAGTGVGIMDGVAYGFAALSGVLLGSLIDAAGTHNVVFSAIALACILGSALVLMVRR